MKPHHRQDRRNFAAPGHDARAAASALPAFDPFLHAATRWPIVPDGERAAMEGWRHCAPRVHAPIAAGPGRLDGHRATRPARLLLGIGASALLAAMAMFVAGTAPATAAAKPSAALTRPDDTPTGLPTLQPYVYEGTGRFGPLIDGGWIAGTFQ